jgi:hypothetical protein
MFRTSRENVVALSDSNEAPALSSYLAGDAFGDGDALVRGQVPGCGVEGEAEALAVDQRGGGHPRIRRRRRRSEAGGCAVTPAIRRQASSATASR